MRSSRYPDILYVHFIWTDSDRARFNRDSQRARYLKCNALISPLPAATPVYAIQYIGYSSCPTYTTAKDSLVVFATKSPSPTYYLCATTQLELILKRWNKRWPASGPEPEARLNQPPEMWKRQSGGQIPTELHQLDPLKIGSPQALYFEITRRCAPLTGDIRATFTARDMGDIIPRPGRPEDGVMLGHTIEEPT